MSGDLMPLRLRLDRHTPPLEALVGLGLAAGLGAGLALAFLLPAKGFGLPCTFLHLTGLPCLTCGMTRAFMAGVHGHPLDALLWNPLGALSCLISACAAPYLVARQLGAPALRLELGPLLRRWRPLSLLVIALNWAFVVLAGRVG